MASRSSSSSSSELSDSEACDEGGDQSKNDILSLPPPSSPPAASRAARRSRIDFFTIPCPNLTRRRLLLLLVFESPVANVDSESERGKEEAATDVEALLLVESPSCGSASLRSTGSRSFEVDRDLLGRAVSRSRSDSRCSWEVGSYDARALRMLDMDLCERKKASSSVTLWIVGGRGMVHGMRRWDPEGIGEGWDRRVGSVEIFKRRSCGGNLDSKPTAHRRSPIRRITTSHKAWRKRKCSQELWRGRDERSPEHNGGMR